MAGEMLQQLGDVASIAGIDFGYTGLTTTTGRRVQTVQFPSSNAIISVDLGEEAIKYVITGYFLSSNYIPLKQALMDALRENAGPHEFRNPYEPNRIALVELDGRGALRFQETAEQGGKVSFQISVIVQDSRVLPQFRPNFEARSLSLSGVALRASLNDFESKWEQTGFNVSKLQSSLFDAAFQLSRVNATIASRLGVINTISSSIDSFGGQIDTLLNSPNLLFQEIQNLTLSVMALAQIAQSDLILDTPFGRRPLPARSSASPSAGYAEAMRLLRTVQFRDVPSSESRDLDGQPLDNSGTPNEATTRNIHTLNRALNATIATNAAAGITEINFDTGEDVLAVQQQLADAVRDAVLSPETGIPPGGDPNNYEASAEMSTDLRNMAASVGQEARNTAARLPSELTIQHPEPLPTSLIAYWFFGDWDRVPDLVARNTIPHHALAGSLRPLKGVPDA